MEVYRSGHNGPDSKSGSPHGLVGSNPTASVILKHHLYLKLIKFGYKWCFFYLFIKSGKLKLFEMKPLSKR